MKSRRNLPCILALEFYLIVCGISIAYSVMRTHGHFMYPLDDTYISMDIAKNLAQHGVMGLTRYGFSFSSSCPLWIWLIALADTIVGAAWWAPLLLGLTAGLAVVFVAYRILERYYAATTAGLLAVIVLTPLPAMALSGMEHALHIALVLWFVAGACEWLVDGSERRSFMAIAVVVPFLVMTRYESLFLAGIFALLLLARRKWLHASAILFLAVVPVVLLGMFSVSKGWEWLPNSLLLKGNVPDFSSLAGVLSLLGLRSVGMLFGTPHLLALVAALLATCIWRAARGDSFWTRGQLMTVFAVAGTFLHLQFASVGWFYRYEAYLVALGVVALLVNQFDELARQVWGVPKLQTAAAGLAVLLGAFPLTARGAEAIWGFPVAAHNLFEQQYQMALFFQKYYKGASVALNDVGFVNYLADIRCLDLYGLCDRQVLALKRHRAYDTVAMANRAEAARVQIAVVYEKRFGADYGPPIPSTWKRVGAWHISDNSFLGGDTVTFYAVQPAEGERLAGCLREFALQLPPEVTPTIVL